MKDIMAYLDKVPYCVTRRTLYNAAELYEGFMTDQHQGNYGSCFDGRVYQYYLYTGKQDSSVEESLASRHRLLEQASHRGRVCHVDRWWSRCNGGHTLGCVDGRTHDQGNGGCAVDAVGCAHVQGRGLAGYSI